MPRKRPRGVTLPTKGRHQPLLSSSKQQSQHRGSCFGNPFVGLLVTLLLVLLMEPLDSSTFQSMMVSLPSEVDALYEYSKSSPEEEELSENNIIQQKLPQQHIITKPNTNTTLPFPVPIPRDLHMEKILPRLLPLFSSSNRLINLGAGVRDEDPTYSLLDTDDDSWEALLVDGAEDQEKLMAERFPSDKIHTKVVYITADSISDLLSQHGFDDDVDLLKIDIDSFDCHVVDRLLETVRPSLIVMEVNVKFPANVRFAFLPGKDDEQQQYPFDTEQRRHVYGCSLAYQVNDLMRPHDYEILYLDENNALYYDQRTKVLQDYTPLSLKDLYNRGYWKMPNRETKFSFNNELTAWQDYNAGEVFSVMQTNLKYVSHGHHRVVLGDLAKDGGSQPPLRNGCFDPESGVLKDCSKGNE